MAKSKYAERLRSGGPFVEDILDEQVGRLRRANPKDRASTLRDWADLAGAEAAVKDRYQGRYLFELIQNSNDAIVDAQEGSARATTDDHLVRLELTEQSLLVANFGKPFDGNNVRALCRLHHTTKSASKQIGHKGIGFKSVLEVCDRPEVYSDTYAFGYDGETFRRDVAKVMGPNWDTHTALPILRAPYPRYVNRLAPEERDRIDSLFDDGYVTVIRLPLDDPTLAGEIAERIEQDVTPTLLLFMPAISQVEVSLPDGRDTAFFRDVVPVDGSEVTRVLVYRSDSGVTHLDARWLRLGPVAREITDRSLVTSLKDKAWHDVTALRFALAFPLAERVSEPSLSSTSQPFYVYYPTQEFSGLRFAVHGDFHVGDDRKTLPLNPLNEWLITEICEYLATDGIEHLKHYWPHDAQLVELLAPIGRPERAFPRRFQQQYLRYLSMALFVPIEGQHYKAPEDVRLPPEEVDYDSFRELFPASKLRESAKWAYPIADVVDQERARATPFLMSVELGGQDVTPELVVEALRRDGMPALADCFGLVTFLADWYDSLPPKERPSFASLLRGLPILPTANGWRKPGDGLVFQANLRPNVEDIATPAGFDFSVIVRSAYPERGTRSNQYALFSALGAREYSARALIRDAILPVLTAEERFRTLLADYSSSVFKAYVLLKTYYDDDRSTSDFGERLGRVPVPATDGLEDGWLGWRQAGDCYFGEDWPGGDVLERLLAGLDDCYFLADVPELGLDDRDDARDEWMQFFAWLGVRDHPVVLESSGSIDRWAVDPFGGSLLWDDYKRSLRDQFRCRNPSKRHGSSRSLDPAHAVAHLADLVREGDPDKLMGLYGLIARHWFSEYRHHLRSWMECSYTSTSCPRDQVEDYLLYELKNTRWIPAQVGGEWMDPLSPREIWVLGETDPEDVCRLVPTLASELRTGDFRDLAGDLGFISTSSARVEDYVRLLQLLPERYPLELPDASEEDQKRWHRSIRAVFNWVCERIQTGLGSRGDRPPVPDDLQVLAFRGDDLHFCGVRDPALVFPDDSFLAERWEPHCAFLRVNDDWQRLLDWLGVADLSEVVESRWTWEGRVEEQTRTLRERFESALPYYVALIKNSQPASYDRLLARLRRLRIHVVRSMVVEDTLARLPTVDPLSSSQLMHLEITADPNPRGGQPVRGGDLYATEGILDNLDLLGPYIAEYVEIARLGDAFVILINRRSDEGRLRFVRSKGVSEEILQQVFADLELPYSGVAEHESADALDKLAHRAIEAAKASGAEPTPAADEHTDSTPTETEPEETTIDGQEPEPPAVPAKPRYPPLSFAALAGVVILDPDSTRAEGLGDHRHGGTGGSGYGWGAPTEVTEELGRRGEEWAYRAERHRLSELGFDPDELEEMGELDWIARRQPTANHDIKSIRVTEEDEQRDVYIEVKASSGDDRRIRISRGEFELALSLGDSYWLYWVANVDTARPDPPVCYPNLAQFIADKKVDLHVKTLLMTLPAPTDGSDQSNEGD